MLDEDDVKVTQKEPEDTVLVAPSSPASLLTPTASVTQVGLGKRSFSIRDIQVCQLGVTFLTILMYSGVLCPRT